MSIHFPYFVHLEHLSSDSMEKGWSTYLSKRRGKKGENHGGDKSERIFKFYFYDDFFPSLIKVFVLRKKGFVTEGYFGWVS